VLNTGAEIASGNAPATDIAQWDALVYNLEANKTYTFYITSTKWRLAAFRYITGTTGINAVAAKQQPIDGKTYNLQGQEVKQPARGLYIQNGRKILVK
jgi:hypothetical protein